MGRVPFRLDRTVPLAVGFPAGVGTREGLKRSQAEPGRYATYWRPLRVASSDRAPVRVVLSRGR